MAYKRGKTGRKRGKSKSSRGRTGSRKKSTYVSLSKRQLHVYHNPFSNATAQPKIPDGRCTQSLGMSFASRREVAVGAFNHDGTTNNDNNMIQIVMFPGIDNGVVIYNTAATPVVMPYDNHVRWTTSGTGEVTIGQGSSETLSRWRLVSQAMNIALVNGAEQNDGWWEAIRFAGRRDTDAFVFDTTNECIRPKSSTSLTGVPGSDPIASSTMVQSVSYASGKLRDLHKIQFRLKALDLEHPFNMLRAQYAHESTATLALTEAQNEFFEANVDPSHDMIVIRLHGHKQIGTVAESATRVRVHVTSNQELMYREGTRMHRAETPSASAQSDTTLKSGHQQTSAAENP